MAHYFDPERESAFRARMALNEAMSKAATGYQAHRGDVSALSKGAVTFAYVVDGVICSVIMTAMFTSPWWAGAFVRVVTSVMP